MHKLLCDNLKLTRRVLTANLLNKLANIGIGTNEVERFASRMCRQNVQMNRNEKLIRNVMKMKSDDAKYDERIMRRNFRWSSILFSRMVRRGSALDLEFRNMMRKEVEMVWNIGKEKNKEKIRTLINRFNPEKNCDKIRDVEFTDEGLEGVNISEGKTVITYDDVEISNEMEAALSLHPKYMLYKRIDEKSIEVEIEKGCVKARYGWMNEVINDDTTHDVNMNDKKPEVYDAKEKKLDYANLRATDIPTVQRLFPPKPASLRRETIMQNIKDKMLNKVKEYKENKCNEKGCIKNQNVSKQQADGLKEVKENNDEYIVFTTDKSGHFTVDSPQNYEKAMDKHVRGDNKINIKKVRTIEIRMNHHQKQFNKMFRAGATWGHQRRVVGATTSTHVPPPPIYGLRKDHKILQPGQEKAGHPVRPVVGANHAPNSRLSHFLSDVVNKFADCEEIETECKSSEEMRSAFDEFNKLNKDVRMKCKVLSMDVKSLYPSMTWANIVLAVREMIENSSMKFENVDWQEVGKYLAVIMTEAEINAEGLRNVIPRRREGVRRLRRITVRYLHEKRNSAKWLPARRPGVRQQRKMLALAVSYGVKTVLSNHTYKLGDNIYLQTEGGPIGLELTQAVSRP